MSMHDVASIPEVAHPRIDRGARSSYAQLQVAAACIGFAVLAVYALLQRNVWIYDERLHLVQATLLAERTSLRDWLPEHHKRAAPTIRASSLRVVWFPRARYPRHGHGYLT
jgi:hypothetical protein